ncbi:hypothetical protein JW964_01665 [candidate division KSB1 bacterium]|nr:hypothetical protein [candidate division KSB1 bacterium]
MSISISISDGFRQVLKNWKMLILFYLINFIWALLITLPFSGMLTKSLGNSLAAKELLQGFDFQIFFEFLKDQPMAMPSLMKNLLFFSLLYLPLTLFFLGGVIKVLYARKQKFSFPFFLVGSYEFFGRFVKLFLLWLIGVVGIVLFNMLVGGGINLITKNFENEMIGFWFFWLRTGIVLFFVFLLNLVFDYARIITVCEDRENIFSTFRKAFSFFWHHKGKTLGLYYMILLYAVLLTVFYWLLAELLHFDKSISVVLVILVQQVYVLARFFIKFLFYAAQKNYYISQTRILEPVEGDFPDTNSEILFA